MWQRQREWRRDGHEPSDRRRPMTPRPWRWLIGCSALALVFAGAGHAQAPGTPTELMAALKVGQWVKLDGPAGKDPLVQCSEAKMLTGDFVDGDWQITSA